MSTFKFECSYCCHFKTKKYILWMKHLVGEGHQVQVRERIEGFPLKDKQRCAVVFGVSLVKETAVLKCFGDRAVVSNFVYWTGRKDFCIVQFLRRSFRNIVLGSSHTINGQKVLAKAREKISDVEWLSICPFIVPEIEMEVEEVEGQGQPQPDDIFKDSEDESEFVDGEGDSDDSCRTVFLKKVVSKDRRGRLIRGQELNGRATSRIQDRHEGPSSAEEGIHRTDTEPVNTDSLLHDVETIPRPKKRRKQTNIIEELNIPLVITEEFREKARLVNSLRFKALLKESLFNVWHELVNDFNEIVWPSCFGIKLSLTCINNNNFTPIYEGEGVLIEPDKMMWINRFQMQGPISKTPWEVIQHKLALFSSVLLQYKSGTIILSADGSYGDVGNSSLKFTIRLSYFFCSDTTQKANVNVNFSNVRGTVNIGSRRNWKLLKIVYTRLWEAYLSHRLPANVSI